MPWGRGEEDTGQLSLTLGHSYQTRDFRVAARPARWAALPAPAQARPEQRQLKMANGPASRGVRPPCRQRLVQVAEQIGNPLQRLSYPPDHRTSTPMDRGWGMLDLHGKGTPLLNVETRLAWAKSLTWKGLPPVGALRRQA